MVILGLDSSTSSARSSTAHERGQIPPTVMWGACPTLFDPSQAPPGKHTAFMWEKLPVRLQATAATGMRPRTTTAGPCSSCGRTYSPRTWRTGPCSTAFTRSPLDTERTLPNMQHGDLLVGSFANGPESATTVPSPGRALPHAGARPVPVRRLDAPRREHHRPVRLQCGASGCGRPGDSALVEPAGD